MNDSLLELKRVLEDYDGTILYEPLESLDEIDYFLPSFPIKIFPLHVTLPACSDSDPFSWNNECIKKFKNHKPYILIPGRRFDIYGHRIGNGGGWYDRFLSKVPREWLRIGICQENKISFDRIKQNPWDESMDFVLVLGKTWRAFKAISLLPPHPLNDIDRQ